MLGQDITADANIKSKVDLDLNGKTLTGNASFTTTATGTITLGAGTVTGNLTVNNPNASFVNNATVNGTTTITDVADHTFTNNGTLHGVTINDANGTRFVNGSNATVGTVTVDALNAPVLLEGTIPTVVVSKAATLTVTGNVTSLTANAAVALEGTGKVVGTTGTGVITTGADVTVETGSFETIAPLISDEFINSDGPNRINVGFKVNEDINLSLDSKANIIISYFKLEAGKETVIKTTAGNDLVKNKTWSGYLNGPTGDKYGMSTGTSYSNDLKMNTLVTTTVDPKYANMQYVDGAWVGDATIVAKVQVIDNAGNTSEIKTLTFSK